MFLLSEARYSIFIYNLKFLHMKYGRFLEINFENIIKLGRCVALNTDTVNSAYLEAVLLPNRFFFFPLLHLFLWKLASLALSLFLFLSLQKQVTEAMAQRKHEIFIQPLLNHSADILTNVCFPLKVMHTLARKPWMYLYIPKKIKPRKTERILSVQ